MVRGLLSTTRIAQFATVGIAGAIVDMGVLGALHGWAGVGLLPAKVLAAELAIVVVFTMNESWTFGDEGVGGPLPVLRRFVTSNAIRVLGIAVATSVLLGLTTWFDVWFLAANAAGLGVGGGVNYVFEALLAWRIYR